MSGALDAIDSLLAQTAEERFAKNIEWNTLHWFSYSDIISALLEGIIRACRDTSELPRSLNELVYKTEMMLDTTTHHERIEHIIQLSVLQAVVVFREVLEGEYYKFDYEAAILNAAYRLRKDVEEDEKH